MAVIIIGGTSPIITDIPADDVIQRLTNAAIERQSFIEVPDPRPDADGDNIVLRAGAVVAVYDG